MSKTHLAKLVRAFDAKGVARLLDASPDLIGVRDDRGRGWLHLCCSVDAKAKRLRPGAQVATARVLIAAGLGLDDAAFTEGNGWQATPLWFAVARGRNLKLAVCLLDEGGSPEYCMHAAAHRSDLKAIRLLLDHGASVDPATHPDTPLLDSLRGGRFDVARLLLEAGADVDHQNLGGMTPLHIMLKGRAEAKHVRMVVGYGPRGDLRDRSGRSVFEIMSKKRDPEIRKLASLLV